MNRLILIGNGFDLAHKLETSYGSFITYEWNKIFSVILDDQKRSEFNEMYIDGLSTARENKKENKYLIVFKNKYIASSSPRDILRQAKLSIDKYDSDKRLTKGDFNKLLKYFKEELIDTSSDSTNKFFMDISNQYINKNWSDVEADYFRSLKKYANLREEHEGVQKAINKLNCDFQQVKEFLMGYLKTQEGKEHYDVEVEEMKNMMFGKIKYDDIRNDKFLQEYLTKELLALNLFKWKSIHRLLKIDQESSDRKMAVYQIVKKIIEKPSILEENLLNKYDLLNLKSFYPNQYYFLNFNYTNTAEKYIGKRDNCQINYIHGKLEDLDSMIFGYGDEEAEEYKLLEQNDNKGLLDNVKSIRYLEANQYSNLESFVDSDYYQIYLMGLSCGLCDRTLLRKLFQHSNCVGIKIFYHKKSDNIGDDNFRDIVQNISRCFSDKDLLRTRVVDKTNCTYLTQVDLINRDGN